MVCTHYSNSFTLYSNGLNTVFKQFYTLFKWFEHSIQAVLYIPFKTGLCSPVAHSNGLYTVFK